MILQHTMVKSKPHHLPQENVRPILSMINPFLSTRRQSRRQTWRPISVVQRDISVMLMLSKPMTSLSNRSFKGSFHLAGIFLAPKIVPTIAPACPAVQSVSSQHMVVRQMVSVKSPWPNQRPITTAAMFGKVCTQ